MRMMYCFVHRIIIVILLIGKISVSSAQDIPGASANIQTAPAGTLVIAMDHTNQATSTINTASGTYLFNLKAYGLVTLFRNAGINVNWVINSAKAKDGIDFTGTAERVYPSYVAAQSLNFLAGPFLIFPSDTLGADYLIQWFNYSLPDSCKVKVYKLTADVDVDVRYTLTNPPRVGMLHDSCDIHRNFMETASVPTVNYDCLDNASGIINGCYTIVTEPHIDNPALDSYTRDSIYNFIVMAGGNFLAQCDGIQTFENLSFYQSTGGGISTAAGGGFNNNVYSDNPAMAYGQYQGTYRPRTRGALQIWRYNSGTANNFYPVVRTRNTPTGTDYYAATVSKMASGLGGLVFYLGNHEFFTNDCHTCLSSNTINEAEINGIRLYLNAVQIPSKIIPCIVLDVKLDDFTAKKQINQTALLKWQTLSETNNNYFAIEHSVDAKNFIPVGKILSNGNTSRGHDYSFTHSNPVNGMNYYRLKMVDINGKAEYSSVRMVAFGKSNNSLTIFPNPAANKTTLLFDEKDGEKLFVKLIDGAGRTVKQLAVAIKNQQAELDLEGLHKGMYVVIAVTENGQRFSSKIMINQ